MLKEIEHWQKHEVVQQSAAELVQLLEDKGQCRTKDYAVLTRFQHQA
jgi:hypothetical protein